MAHLNKPSLMSRLFPQENRAAGHLSSSEDLSSSTLFARMSSPGLFSASKAPFLSSSSRDEQLRPNDVFRACYATFSNDATKSKVREERITEGDGLAQLREAFAQEGVELYTSVVEKLAEAQQDIASQISDFANLSSSMAADMDDLYANLSYPLSTTLCHSKNFPQATIGAHLASVKEQLKQAESELRDLECEWEDNVRSEERLRQELASMEKNPGYNGEPGHNDESSSQMAHFKQEVERIVTESTQALDEIEEGYKEEVQAQTMKMMQAMLVD